MSKKYPGRLPSDSIMAEIEHTLKKHAGDQQNLIETLRYLPAVLSEVASGSLAEQRDEIADIKRRLDAAFASILAANKTASDTVEAASGHLRESGEIAKRDTLADKMADWATLMKNEAERVKSDPAISRAFLHIVDAATFKAEFEQLQPDRQRELMPELFLDGGE